MGWIDAVTRPAPALISLVAGIFASGIAQVSVVPALALGPQPIAERIRTADWSPQTAHLLDHLGLKDLADHDPLHAFTLIEQGIEAENPGPERLLALAEIADRIAQKAPADEALARSRDAAAYAIFCLEALRVDGPQVDIRCNARDVHNRAVYRCLQRARTNRSDWSTRLSQAGILTTSTVWDWTALGFDSLQPMSEFGTVREESCGQRSGLGVPLNAQRRLADAELLLWKRYGPREVVFAATAVMRPCGPLAGWRGRATELVLHDPLNEESLTLGAQAIPLAHDLASPLARRLGQDLIRNYQYLGVLDRDFYVEQAGVFAIDPYVPGKVPVVLVPGLWSGPKVWVPMLTALRSDPVLRSSYQFWVVLYPSGDPLPLAARALRRSLREIRQTVDPYRVDPALDRMVILGKSTGGQVVRMLAEASGTAVWNAVFTRPLEQINATEAVRDELASMFFFEPEPYLRRVIFVTTAHRGGRLARQPGVRLGVELIRRNNPLRSIWANLEAADGLLIFQPPYQNRAPSSIDGLQAGSLLLCALDAQSIAPRIAYHSIIANIHRYVPADRMTDGFVTYASAHLDGAVSERVVTASHLCEADPEVITEVRRILLENADETNGVARQSPEQILGLKVR